MDEIFPKDIVMHIYRIVHKDIITKLNKEYNEHVKYTEGGHG